MQVGESVRRARRCADRIRALRAPSALRRAAGSVPGESAFGGEADALGDATVLDRDSALGALWECLGAAQGEPASILGPEAVRAAAAVLAVAGSDPDADPMAAQALGWYHWLRYQAAADGRRQDDMAAAARYLTPAYRAAPGSVPPALREFLANREARASDTGTDPDVMTDRAADLFRAYQRTGQPGPLEQAITLFRAALVATPADHRNRARPLSNLGVALLALFERTGELSVLTEAVQAGRDAVAAFPRNHPERAAVMNNLGIALRILSERTGNQTALGEAVQAGRDAVAATPRDHPDHAALLGNLGLALRVLSERTGELAVLTEAVQVGRRAVAAMSKDHPARAMALDALGASLQRLFEQTGDQTVLDEAVQAGRDAVAATPRGHPERASRLGNLGTALQALFGRTGELPVLVEAAEARRDVVAATPQDDPRRAVNLNNLGTALRELFERTGDLAVLGEAVQAGRDAIAATPQNHPDRAAVLSNLGTALQVLSERTGESAIRVEAAKTAREAVSATAHDDPRRAMYLGNLGNILRVLFGSTGELAVLVEAVQAERDAVAATPQDHPDRAAVLNSLGTALRALFGRTEDLSLLVEAVRIGREAVSATPHDDPRRARRLGNLGNALLMMFGRTWESSLLAEAVQAARDAVAATPQDHPDRAIFLNNLGGALLVFSELTGDSVELDEAVQAGRDAVAATPRDHPDRVFRLSNLGIALRALFEQTGDSVVLDEAVQAGRDAVAATPRDHPDRTTALNNLGDSLEELFRRTGERGVLEEARRCFREGAASTTGTTLGRIAAYRQFALVSGGDHEDKLQAVEAAVDLVDTLVPGSLARSDREFQLGRLANLAGEAAAAALAADRPERAVELLERTRGILAADTLGVRGQELTCLRDHDTHAHLAHRLELLRSRLDALDQPRNALPQDPDTTHDPQAAMEAYRHLAADRSDTHAAWQRLLDEIRALPGFEGFFRPPSINTLARQAHHGPIVFITTSPTRCDALVLTDTPDPVHVVPLTRLTHDDAHAHARRLLTARLTATDPDRDPAERQTAQRDILAVLARLWDTVTEPVLAHLGHTTTPTGDAPWPRVWWCLVGIMALLPLHAAGRHDTSAGENGNPAAVLDRVISSYTPTIQALAHARTPRPPASTPGPVLIVPVPDLPGAELPGVNLETTAITSLIPHTRLLTHPTRPAVLRAVPEHRIAHFSCHGYADRTNPAHSRLILDDHATAPLTVADITALNLDADLAYLSACDTAVTPLRLADESLHITAAFHLAGYRHVIGTLWSVNDHAAAELAEAFYTHLTHHGTTPPRADHAAHALHHAIRRQRTRYPLAPTLWATHTHTGI